MDLLGNVAALIKANMSFSRGDTLSDQDAWGAAMFMDAHERLQASRFDGSVSETRKKYHDTPMSFRGTEVNGHLLGASTGER